MSKRSVDELKADLAAINEAGRAFREDAKNAEVRFYSKEAPNSPFEAEMRAKNVEFINAAAAIRYQLRKARGITKRVQRLSMGEVLSRIPEGLRDCFEWQGSRCLGYGKITINGKRLGTHRVAYAVANGISLGDIEGLVVRHKCDNPPCINPLHLTIGTQADNCQDTKERGRLRSAPHLVGANKPGFLSATDVLAIRAQIASGDGPAKVARAFKVSTSTIYNIKRGQTWAHL